MSVNYSDPWREKEKRAEQAKKIYNHFKTHDKRNTEYSIVHTKHKPARKDDFMEPYKKMGRLPEISVVNQDSVGALIGLPDDAGKVAILNFASYKNPGGMFMKGSIAQEEALCHESNLYNILFDKRIQDMFYTPNQKRLNRALYNDNLLYTPNVQFFRGTSRRVADVITAAAPNKGAAQKYQNVSNKECDDAMRSRIRHILFAAIEEGVETIILGAYGCGVFKNDPKTVAQIFKEELVGCPFKAVFAVPGDKFEIFNSVLVL